MDAAAEMGRDPVGKHQIQPEYGRMSRLKRDETAEPVSRDQVLRRERGQGNIHFPGSADHEQDWQPYPVGPYPGTRLLLLLRLLIHTVSVLPLQLKKLRGHTKSAIELSNANPACGPKEVRRSTGHLMVTTRYSDQQGSKSRQTLCHSTSNGTDQCQNGSSNLLAPDQEQSRSTRIVLAYLRTAFSATNRTNYAPTTFDNKSKFLKATHRTKMRKIEIPRSMVVEALSW